MLMGEKEDAVCNSLTYYTKQMAQRGYQGFESLIQKLKKRFGKKDLPQTLRAEFSQLRQSTEENLDDWADRVYDHAMDAYAGMADTFIQEEATRRFCQRLLDKECASFVGGRLPTNLDEAVRSVREFTQNCKAVYGNSRKVRTVVVDEEDTSTHQIRQVQASTTPSKESSELSEIKALLQGLATSLQNVTKREPTEEFRRSRQMSRSPNRRRFRFSASIHCYGCGGIGHMKNECP